MAGQASRVDAAAEKNPVVTPGMNVNLIGLAAVCLSVAAFKVAFEVAKSASHGKRVLGLLVFAALGSPALLYAVYYLHVLPERPWFYELRSWPGSEFFVVPLGVSSACLAAMLPRKLLSLILLSLVALGVIPYLKPVLVPLPRNGIKDQWRDEACLQSTPSTCGPASIASILRFHGMPASEREIARAAHTYAGGTEAWYLARYVRSRGLAASFDFRPGLPEDLRLPALIGVRLGGFGHFMPVLSRDKDMLVVADPLHGLETIHLKELEKRCRLTGFHLSVPLAAPPRK